MNNTSSLLSAGFFRRLTALLYDSLIVVFLLFVAGGMIMIILEALVAIGVLSYGPYQNVSQFLTRHPTVSPAYTLYLATIWIYFFVYCWTKHGQTLGMKASKILVRNQDGSLITTTQALIRLATAGLGLGNLTVLIDPQKRSFQDIWAKTEVVVVSQSR
ncbi:RDD family protein [Vibrio metschnikovii]|uniref:RDD family protein n=1 Tax=Vibrio metschnikovii TaxID=28172 RepID=UPI00164BE22D|nr:RDD family protein [Vibrio metschnikovii]MBC5831144.1 RDD family protein [Vibrio metschnikovii]